MLVYVEDENKNKKVFSKGGSRQPAAHLQYMGDGHFRRPVSLKGVDADVTVRRHVGVVDLREEKPSRGRVRKVVAQDKLDVKRTTIVRRLG